MAVRIVQPVSGRLPDRRVNLANVAENVVDPGFVRANPAAKAVSIDPKRPAPSTKE